MLGDRFNIYSKLPILVVTVHLQAGFAVGAASSPPLPNIFCNPEKKSTGTGKITVVFFSTPISVKVCK
jgi:hypothetical protein